MDKNIQIEVHSADLIVVGGTPAGIMAGIAAAENGLSVIILERSHHVGGLPANGLGATDISTRGLAAGLFRDFTNRIRDYYEKTYGIDSEQYKTCSSGYHFEPSVAENILNTMLSEHPGITLLLERQLDPGSASVDVQNGVIASLKVLDRSLNRQEVINGTYFVDATYEGDLAASSGVPFTVRREGKKDYGEEGAGVYFQAWESDKVGEGSTGEGDDAIQAYNYRMCLTDHPENRIDITQPVNYDRNEYVSLIDDLKYDRKPGEHSYEMEWDGIGRVTNIVELPNGKTDANNQHLAFISTDLPEENWPWPTADWAWRDQFALRLREYTLGLLWFIQNDPEVPEPFRTNARKYGLAADEYVDNGNFPRQVYVREGRRIIGESIFLAHDAFPETPGGRPPVHPDSVTASHYAIDSHAVRKRDTTVERDHLDGFLNRRSKPYTVPYGVMVPKKVRNLWVPVAVSSSHLGLGTIRMEPCWMCLGEVAGLAASLASRFRVPARQVPVDILQKELVKRKAMLIYYTDVDMDDSAYEAVQYFALQGVLPGWTADLDQVVTANEFSRWAELAHVSGEACVGKMKRREALMMLWEKVWQRADSAHYAEKA